MESQQLPTMPEEAAFDRSQSQPIQIESFCKASSSSSMFNRDRKPYEIKPVYPRDICLDELLI
jgi:hypothetical protein